jgi:hypothetical protein
MEPDREEYCSPGDSEDHGLLESVSVFIAASFRERGSVLIAGGEQLDGNRASCLGHNEHFGETGLDVTKIALTFS